MLPIGQRRCVKGVTPHAAKVGGGPCSCVDPHLHGLDDSVRIRRGAADEVDTGNRFARDRRRDRAGWELVRRSGRPGAHLVRRRALANGVPCPYHVVISLPVRDPRVGVGEDVPGVEEEDLTTCRAPSINSVVRDGRSSVGGRSLPGQTNDAVPRRGRQVPCRRGGRRGACRGRGGFVGPRPLPHPVDRADHVVVRLTVDEGRVRVRQDIADLDEEDLHARRDTPVDPVVRYTGPAVRGGRAPRQDDLGIAPHSGQVLRCARRGRPRGGGGARLV